MPSYVVMFPADDEDGWEAADEADRQATYDVDGEFVARLRAAGGAVTGGAALAHSRGMRTLRRGGESTRGPSAGSTAQLSGLLLVTCADEPALLEAAEVLTRAHPVVEVRPVDEEG